MTIFDSGKDIIKFLIRSEVRDRQYNPDIEAFKLLYDRYAPALFNLIVKIKSDRISASKVLEECFLEMWVERKFYDN